MDLTHEQIKADLDRLQLDDKTREELENLCTSWLQCSKQKIFLENLSRLNLEIREDGIYNGRELMYPDISSKNTIFLQNCRSLTLKLNIKINHLTLLKCDDIRVIPSESPISGIDIISCNNITTIVFENSLNYLDTSNSTDCHYLIDSDKLTQTVINTMGCYKLSFTIVGSDRHVISKYDLFFSLFDTSHKILFFVPEYETGIPNMMSFEGNKVSIVAKTT